MKFKIQMVDDGEVIEDMVDDVIYDDEDEAMDEANYLNSCTKIGSEILYDSNPSDYEEDFAHEENYEYIVTEIDD